MVRPSVASIVELYLKLKRRWSAKSFSQIEDCETTTITLDLCDGRRAGHICPPEECLKDKLPLRRFSVMYFVFIMGSTRNYGKHNWLHV
jgi:hypothetical protein